MILVYVIVGLFNGWLALNIVRDGLKLFFKLYEKKVIRDSIPPPPAPIYVVPHATLVAAFSASLAAKQIALRVLEASQTG